MISVIDSNAIMKNEKVGGIVMKMHEVLTFFTDGSERELELVSQTSI